LLFSDTKYALYPEKIPSGVRIFRAYFELLDPETGAKERRWTGVQETGSRKAESEAHGVVRCWLDSGALPPKNQRRNSKPLPQLPEKGPTIGSQWGSLWDWKKCLYLKKRLAFDPKSISEDTAAGRRSLFLKHILPVFGHKTVQEITIADLEDFVTDLLGTHGLSTQTAKHAVQVLKPIFEEAVKNRLIAFNPILGMTKISVRVVTERDVFTLQETRKLLTLENVWQLWVPHADSESKWGGTLRNCPDFNPYSAYAITLMAALTGVRIGTIVALTREDIVLTKKGQAKFYAVSFTKRVCHKSGLKAGTKTGSGTTVPIAYELLHPVLEHLPQTGFLFPSTRGKTGILHQRSARTTLFSALAKIGISEDERKKRKLGFHSFRHTWVTQAAASGVSDDVQSGFTEHKDRRTRLRYTHLGAGDKLAAIAVQRKIAPKAKVGAK
jgi:integrase